MNRFVAMCCFVVCVVPSQVASAGLGSCPLGIWAPPVQDDRNPDFGPRTTRVEDDLDNSRFLLSQEELEFLFWMDLLGAPIQGPAVEGPRGQR